MDSRTAKAKKRQLIFFKTCEVLILTTILLLIIGLFLIPTVEYALQVSTDETVSL